MGIYWTGRVFDANPSSSGSCAWPEDYDHEYDEGRSRDANLEEFLAEISDDAVSGAGCCPDYESGDSLWIRVWDEDGMILETHEVTL